MIKLAGGSVFLGIAALFGTFLYSQTKVEAKPYFSESYTRENLQQTILQTDIQSTNYQETQQIQQAETKTQTSLVESTENSENEYLSEAQHFKATAYCLKCRTATGGSVRRGIVAADRRVLPLGSRIQIDAGSYSGTYTVADTGGAVRGRVLDIWVPSCSEANRFGRRSVKVSLVGKKKNS